MKIYNSKAQMVTNLTTGLMFAIVAFGKINTSQYNTIANYDYSGNIQKGLLVACMFWVTLTVVCSVLTKKALKGEILNND